MAGVLALVVAFFACVEALRPLPFATSNDGWSYFLPLIRAHTDAALAGVPLRMVWQLGDGWSPWESGQVGLLYPLFHLANLLARAAGEPFGLLEASALLSLLATALVAWVLAPRALTLRARVGLVLALVFAPGAFHVGLIWHNYLSCVPWFVGLALLVLRNLDHAQPWPRRDRLLCCALSVVFFLSAHVQMYAIGVTLLCAMGAVIGSVPVRVRSLVVLALAQLPLVAASVYFKELSEGVLWTWLSPRYDPELLRYRAAGLLEVGEGTFFGNLLRAPGFRLAPVRMGIFFNPALIAVVVLAAKRRAWGLLAFVAFVLMILAAADFPFVRYLALGPFAGFRWTWKLTIFTAALFLAIWVREALRVERARRWLPSMLVLVAVASAAVALRTAGTSSLPSVRKYGVRALQRAAETCMASSGVPRGARLAYVGDFRHDDIERYPLPIVALGGNAPLLLGFESVHLYEPLEPFEVNAHHLRLSAYWRESVDPVRWREQRELTKRQLLAAGAQALLAAEPGVLDGPDVRSCVDVLGRVTYVERLVDATVASYPRANGARVENIVELDRLPDGRLRTVQSRQAPPHLQSSRRVTWERLQDGRWLGTPRTIASQWLIWTAICTLLAAGLLWIDLAALLSRLPAHALKRHETGRR